MYPLATRLPPPVRGRNYVPPYGRGLGATSQSQRARACTEGLKHTALAARAHVLERWRGRAPPSSHGSPARGLQAPSPPPSDARPRGAGKPPRLAPRGAPRRGGPPLSARGEGGSRHARIVQAGRRGGGAGRATRLGREAVAGLGEADVCTDVCVLV